MTLQYVSGACQPGAGAVAVYIVTLTEENIEVLYLLITMTVTIHTISMQANRPPMIPARVSATEMT